MSKHADTVFAAIESSDTSALVSSWRRSVAMHGLHPDDEKAPVRNAVAFREAQQRDSLLITVANPYLDRLHASLDDSGAVVCVTNRDGMVLSQRTGRRHDVWQRKASQALGSYYDEATLGTCTVGTCVADARPIVLGEGQHFLSRCSGLIGVAAPIHGPNGGILGCVGCVFPTQPSGASRASVIRMVAITFARRIGVELFAAAFPKTRLVLASQDGRKFNAVIAVDVDDRIVGATHAARELLGITDGRLANGLGKRDLFEPPDDLARAQKRLIAQAMVRHANNHSAVAKALGISRSTLYRKLTATPVAGVDDATKPSRP